VQGRSTPRGTTALLVLRDNCEPLGKNAVHWAVDALTDGHDVPSIRILAGLDMDGWPNSFEAEGLVDSAIRELGVPETDRATRARAYVREVATAIVAGEVTPKEGAALIHRRVIGPLNHPADLQPWCYLWEGNAADCSRALEDEESDRAIVEYATVFLAAAAQPAVAADEASPRR
jgi:hypothetical protein